MKYIEIDKSKIKKLYSDGVESNIYLYDLDGQTVLLKLLKDKSSLKNKEKKVNIIIDSDILKDEVNILASASINGQFVGYFMPLDLEYTRTVSDFDKKRVKISALKQLRDKMERFNKNGIYIGDFNEKNILIDKENNIKLCDLDNFKINDLDFDTPSTFVHYFRRNCKNEEKVKRIQEVIKNHNLEIDYDLSYAYSDSLHDIPMLKMVKNRIKIDTKDGHMSTFEIE